MKKIRKENERNFFNRSISSGNRRHLSKFYTISDNSRKYLEKFLIDNCYDKDILEYGCGTGAIAFTTTIHGARATGIDISEIAISVANEKSRKRGIENIRFIAMDAEAMDFEDNSFDMICGISILHHLDINKALKELTRVLKPDGIVLFIEPMGHNLFINIFRKLTPKLRTTDEHPLRKKDLELINDYFHKTHYKYFNLFSLIAVPFRNIKSFFLFLLTILNCIDRFLFKWVPILRLQAWQVVIVLENPKKELLN